MICSGSVGSCGVALKANPHVPAYLLGAKPVPTHLPGYDGIGDDNEAVVYLAEATEGWLDTPKCPVTGHD